MKTYREEMLIRTCNCDFRGTWRPSAILEMMQEVSGMHSYLLGCGRDVLIEKGMVWVLTRLEVQMNRYPKVGDKVAMETFPMPTRRWFFPRYFVMYDEDSQVLGQASSLWVLLDINTRKMLPPGEVEAFIPDNRDMTPPMGMPGAVAEVGGEMSVTRHMPVYTDLDVNGHVNNTKYVDWLCDSLGIDAMADHCLQSICVNYDAEVLPGEEIELRLSRRDLDYSISGVNGDKRHFEIGGKLMARE